MFGKEPQDHDVKNSFCDIFRLENGFGAAGAGAAGPQCPGLLRGGDPFPRVSGGFIASLP